MYDSTVVENAVKVFKSVHLDQDITQEPHSHIDDERFAYFYTDALTHTYNHHYLDVILNKNKGNPLYLNIIYLKNFSSYNQQYGWSEGDTLLNKFSAFLKSEFSHLKIFRIFGDDFVLLSDKPFKIDIDKINSTPILKNNNVFSEHKYVESQKSNINSYKDLEG